VGHLGRDPECRFTPDGTPVTSFSVATSRKWKDASGASQEKTVWFKVSCWRKLAETTNQYLKKGSAVLVVGELSEPRVWQSKASGEWQASLELTASTVRFLSPKSEGAAEASSESPAAPEGDEEIPF
jgi:single-strand DNA-binding protein